MDTELILSLDDKRVALAEEQVRQLGKHSAESLRGFLQYDGEPLSTEELCQPVEYSATF